MRITHLRLQDFRGWAALDLRPRGHVLLAGVPRAGRSDIVAALTRLLDPASIRLQPSLSDIRRRVAPASSAPAAAGTPAITHQPEQYAEVEVTLADLDSELEQLCDGSLEPLDVNGQVDTSGNAASDAPLGVRIAYRVSYDDATDALEQVVYFPVRSNTTTAQYAKVPTVVRRALPVVVLNSLRPLQLRSEGVLRKLITDRDPVAATDAFRALEEAVAKAADDLSSDKVVADTVNAVLGSGHLAGHLASSSVTAADVSFRPEDGSLSALLRAVQPSLVLDDAGLLSVTNHGSTTAALLAAAEALMLSSSVPFPIVLSDDLGEGLDAAASEHLATVLRGRAGQAWVTTRRPEVARAFQPGELIRLSRGSSGRGHHVVPEPSDRKDIALRRLLHMQLLPAMTASVVVITEGPHDLTTYTAADRHRAAQGLPLSAAGVRIISADIGTGGGTGQIPRVATLARDLGFRVIALIDSDPSKYSAVTLPPIEAACDVVIQLPASMAVEEAILAGVPTTTQRQAAATLTAYGLPDPTVTLPDPDVTKALAAVLHKKGLHEQVLDVLVEQEGSLPAVLNSTLGEIASAADSAYAGPTTIQLPAPPP